MDDELIAELAVFGPRSDRAAAALGQAGDPAAIPYLLTALRRDAGWEDRSAACRKAAAIAAIGGDVAVDVLVGQLEALNDADLVDDAGDTGDEYWRIREAAVHGLGLLGVVAEPRLLCALGHPNPDARYWAAVALEAIGRPQAADSRLSEE